MLLSPPRRTLRRWATAIVALVALLVVSGCRVDTTVAVTMGSAGDGSVRVEVVLDHDAASRVPDVGRLLEVDDLRKAGWTIAGPTPTAAGGLAITASKPFGTPEQAEQILESLTGAGGPLRDLDVSRSTGFASTSYRVRATVDLHEGLDAFGDPALVKALGGVSVAEAVKGLARPGDPAPASEVGFHLAVTLPGGAAGKGAARHGDTAVWDVPLGGSARSITASSTRTDPLRIALLVVAVLAALAAVAAGVLGSRRGRRRRRS